jgi:lipoate-protein ligase A
VGVTRRDTFRPGFADAVRAANGEGYPVLVRSSGGGATAADAGTFGFSIIRPAAEEGGRGIPQRYDEAAALVLGAFSRLGLAAEVGEVRDEFCPGDHSVRVGGWKDGMKLCGIAQRVTNRATRRRRYRACGGRGGARAGAREGLRRPRAPFRPASVGSARRAGNTASVDAFLEAFASEAEVRYGARRVPLDEETACGPRATGPRTSSEARISC